MHLGGAGGWFLFLVDFQQKEKFENIIVSKDMPVIMLACYMNRNFALILICSAKIFVGSRKSIVTLTCAIFFALT